MLDPGILAYAIWPRRAYYTMLEETALIPFLGTFTRLLGAIPLVRGPRAIVRQERGFDDAIRHLGLLHFFPEGECYLRNQQVMPFHRGAFHIACRRSLPVVPIAIVLKERTGKISRRLGLPPRPDHTKHDLLFRAEVFCCNGSSGPGPHVREAGCVDDGHGLAGCKVEDDGEGHDGRQAGFRVIRMHIHNFYPGN